MNNTALLESVITTDKLDQRASRLPNYEAESTALAFLMTEMTTSKPQDVLKKLAETILSLCSAHSTGISILEEENGKKIVKWYATAGAWSGYLGETMPRESIPCGTVLDRNCALLVSEPHRYYSIPKEVSPQIAEMLLTPFSIDGKAVGTLWVIAHDDSQQFDLEDKRIMTSLSKFAATVYQLLVSSKIMEESQGLLKEVAKNLDSSNKNLEQFAYVAAHDLQAPLKTASNYMQLLRKKVKSTDNSIEKYVTIVSEQILQMQDLVRGLLAYSKLEQSEVVLKELECGHCLKHALSNLEGIIEESKAEIIVDKLPVISGNKSQIIRLFQNLISNAIKFSKETPRISVQAIEKNKEWMISVSDNGIGIKPEDFNKIFDVFHRLDRNYAGSGIGLGVCKKVVEQHGGKIWVESEVGKGSCFYFTLPSLHFS
jgi:signal transduction histidine kinase